MQTSLLLVAYDSTLQEQLYTTLARALGLIGVSADVYCTREPFPPPYRSQDDMPTPEERLREAMRAVSATIVCCTELGRDKWINALEIARASNSSVIVLLVSHQERDEEALRVDNQKGALTAIVSISRFGGDNLAKRFPGVPTLSGLGGLENSTQIAAFIQGIVRQTGSPLSEPYVPIPAT